MSTAQLSLHERLTPRGASKAASNGAPNMGPPHSHQNSTPRSATIYRGSVELVSKQYSAPHPQSPGKPLDPRRPLHRGLANARPKLALLTAAAACGLASAFAHGQTPATTPAATPDPNAPTYLSTSFREPATDGLRFVWSEDGYKWTEVPGVFLKPWAGPSKLMRDPSLVRGPDGTFHLVWTTGWQGDRGFGYARTKDLVHWSEQRFIPVMEHEPTTVNVWAPEVFYYAPRERFIICWASTIPGRFPYHE
jgi:hypothetical protein